MDKEVSGSIYDWRSDDNEESLYLSVMERVFSFKGTFSWDLTRWFWWCWGETLHKYWRFDGYLKNNGVYLSNEQEKWNKYATNYYEAASKASDRRYTWRGWHRHAGTYNSSYRL